MKEQQKPVRQGQGSTEPDVPRLRVGEDKRSTDGLPEPEQSRSGATELKPRPLAPMPMQTNKMSTRKNRGRLNRDTMKLLGKVLGDYFDHVRQQEVPDHITNLVKQYEDRHDKGSS